MKDAQRGLSLAHRLVIVGLLMAIFIPFTGVLLLSGARILLMFARPIPAELLYLGASVAAVVIASALAFVCARVVFGFTDRDAKPYMPRCDRCGYSLEGLEPDRCPECGNVVA